MNFTEDEISDITSAADIMEIMALQTHMHHMHQLENPLAAQSKADIRNVIDREIKNLLNQKQRLKQIA